MSEKSHDPNQMSGAAMMPCDTEYLSPDTSDNSCSTGPTNSGRSPVARPPTRYETLCMQYLTKVLTSASRRKDGAGGVTSGPAPPNMVTPLTDALMDSIRLVCITGQGRQHLIGNDAVPECDTVGIDRALYSRRHTACVQRLAWCCTALMSRPTRPGPVLATCPGRAVATGTTS